MPNTLLYTSYMMKIIATRPHAEGLAVLLPCFWVYMHVGKCMLKLREELGDRYEKKKSNNICSFLFWRTTIRNKIVIQDSKLLVWNIPLLCTVEDLLGNFNVTGNLYHYYYTILTLFLYFRLKKK